MRKRLYYILALTIFVGCSKVKDTDVPHVEQGSYSESEIIEARKSFASILSKAVAENENLRAFIKETALRKFDMDNDVFYPYVKDQIIPGDGRSFKDILLSYCETPERLKDIEEKEPLLTILVPDWEFLGCFGINQWDPSDSRVAVGYEAQEKDRPLYANGVILGTLTEGQFPAFPTLIIKESDRIKQIEGQTKSGVMIYDFADEAFNPALNPQTKVEHIYMKPSIDGTPDVSNFVPSNEVPDLLKRTYSFLKDNKYAIQRDYAYYGISPTNPEGRENFHIKEYLTKIKFSSFSDCVTDDPNGDFRATNTVWDYKKNHGEKTAQELRDYFYYEGQIELKLYFIVPSKEGGTASFEKVITAGFGDLFGIDYADLDYRHRTAFCRDWYVYTIKENYIRPKWYSISVDLPRWNIDVDSNIISIHVEEMDPSTECTREIDIKRSSTTINKIGGEVSGSDSSVSGKVTRDHSNDRETTVSEKYTIKTTGESDNLGTALLYFNEPVIEGEKKKENGGIDGYNIHIISTGAVDLMIMPREI